MKTKIERDRQHNYVSLEISEEMYEDIRDLMLRNDFNPWYKTVCAEEIWKDLEELPKKKEEEPISSFDAAMKKVRKC